MALSFQDSLKAAKAEREAASASVMTLESYPVATLDYGIATADEGGMIAAYSGDDGDWNSFGDYSYYPNYSDDNISDIDNDKNIVLNKKQFNITQEENSQYIPFKMPRYYDGYDLSTTVITIHYERSDGTHGTAKPINATCSDEYIMFGWLVDGNATKVAGKMKFEIHANGVTRNNAGEELSYVWKTKYNGDLNVLQSICPEDEYDIVVNDKTWMQQLVTDIATNVAEQIAEAEINLTGYATESYVTTQLNNYATKEYANSVVPTNVSTFNNDAGYATKTYVNEAVAGVDVSDQLENYALKTYVDEAVKGVDVSEHLKEYALKTELPTVPENVSAFTNDAGYLTEHQSLEGYATQTYVTEQINAQDITGKLGNYYTKEEVDNVVSNVTVDLTGYAKETYVDNAISPISSSVSANTENLSALSETVVELQTTVSSIDTSPRLTYDVKYNDTEDENVGENVFAFYEITNEGQEDEVREIKQKFTIVGGSGGGATSSTLKIAYITTSPLVVTTNDDAIIEYEFSGVDSSGDAVTEGTATWKVANSIVATETVVAGKNHFDVTKYLSVGTQKVNLTIVDDAGSLVSKNWTVQKIDVRLESTFNDKFTYPIGTVSFDYTPYGAISKDIHFILDGEEIDTVTTSASGIPMAYEISEQEHGAHLLEVYMTAKVNNNDIESNHIMKDIIWYDETSDVPVIGTVYQSFTARQYDATNIEYTVYDPKTETPTVEIAVDGNVVSTPTLTRATNTYTYKTDAIGEHTITITCGETVKTLTANITKIDINVAPVTAGLVFDFNPTGKSNSDEDRVWSNGTVSMSVSDNFDWINGGYQYDENGDQYFCIKAGTSAEIDYMLFADEAKKNGKEFKLVFKTTNVSNPNATFLTCMDNTTETDHVGIRMDVHEATIYGGAGNLNLPYSEEDVIEFEFNISKDVNDGVPMVMGYEDGVSTRPMVYDGTYNFTQNTPKTISLGSEDCDLHIYRFKVYNASLTAIGILNNFIADARNAEEMIDRYERNQIYDENGNLNPDVLAEKCPWLRVYKISAPYFTNNKSDKVPNTTIQQIYKNGDPVLDNWKCVNAMHSGQGTSSNNYGAAGRNLDFIMNKSGIEGVEPEFTLGDNKTKTDKITLTRTSVPVAYLNAKVNIASSNNMTNAMLANKYNEFNPYNRKFVREEGTDTSFIKDTMEFYNCVIFIQETNEDLSTHREFADREWHFYAIGNIGDSKKTDKTRLTDQSDKYECCVEIMDVELPLSDFPVDTIVDAMGYTIDETTKEKVYTWAKDENLDILYEKINGEYVLTEDETIDMSKTYYVDILEHDDFSEDFTYGWRYIYEDGTDEENAEVFDYCKQKWIELYRFITTSTDEEFKAGIGNYFVIDSMLYYYLFTTRYCMVDNRAKNSFWHYGKTGEVDAQGNPIRKWDLSWGYDMDTSLGLNNYGKQVYRYGLEDTDVDENGVEVFRESDSIFFCRVRDLFANELKAMYNTLESKNAWHAESFINKADAWQSEFPEELWRLDIERKYIRTYTKSFIDGEGKDEFLKTMSNGKMKYHRRQWERNQEKYMASKYQSSVAIADSADFRCGKITDTSSMVIKPNYQLKLTPYAHMYLNIQYGSQSPIQMRVEPNIEYEVPYNGSADIIKVYSSSLIMSFGDLSSCYFATVDTSKAAKIKELIIGNDTEGYDNPHLSELTTGANHLLEVLNIENVSGLTQSLNLSALNNLRELYANGSNISGVTFADGGKVEIAELPAISAISMKNLAYLTAFDVVDFSNLTSLIVENCSSVDLISILNSAVNLNRVRITGIDWNITDDSLLARLYDMDGIDKDGYVMKNQSVLSGKVYVHSIKQQKLAEYRNKWKDLEINAGSVTPQHAVTFVNYDGTVLEVQYVDNGLYAIDPVEREDNPIDKPTRESTVSTDFVYAGWNMDLSSVSIREPKTVMAIYNESIRKYTVRYVTKIHGVEDELQSTLAEYGTLVPYEGEIPTYTAEEGIGSEHFYLFSHWDKSGVVDGDKTIEAKFDDFRYTPQAFSGIELIDMEPVQVYAITRLIEMGVLSIGERNDIEDNYHGDTYEVIEGTDIQVGDDYSFTMGYDIDYEDIESRVLISERTSFDGTSYQDTDVMLFDEDRDFVLAIDYEMSTDNNPDAVLMQCSNSNSTNGFKLYYNSGDKLSYGNYSTDASSFSNRNMLVIRHKSGDNNVYVYSSDTGVDSMSIIEISKEDIGEGILDYHTSTLVFGASKNNKGDRFVNKCKGDIYWCKVWYMDLGEETCKQLASWTHEKITLQVDGFKRYQIDGSDDENSISLLAKHLLGCEKKYGNKGYGAGSVAGGWASSTLNAFLNGRFYNSIPYQIRAMMKRVSVASHIGNGTNNTSSSACYVNVPSAYDVNIKKTDYKNELYELSATIDYMVDDSDRIRQYENGDIGEYWLRTPDITNSSACPLYVDKNGMVNSYVGANTEKGVLIEISL